MWCKYCNTRKHSIVARCQHQCGLGPEVNEFEQISSDGHQMLLARGGGPCTVRPHVRRGGWGQGMGTVQWDPMHHGQWSHGTPSPREQTNRHNWKHYIFANSLAGGKNTLHKIKGTIVASLEFRNVELLRKKVTLLKSRDGPIFNTLPVLTFYRMSFNGFYMTRYLGWRGLVMWCLAYFSQENTL